jgi:hypothetical protein
MRLRVKIKPNTERKPKKPARHLDHTKMGAYADPETAILSQPHDMEPRAGVEPAANSLQGCRSGH